MTQKEKTRLHLKRQYKRTGGLLWKLIGPLLLTLPFFLPLFLAGIAMGRSQPGQAYTVGYESYDKTKLLNPGSRIYVLHTMEGETFYLPWQILDQGFRADVKTGRIQQGEELTVTTYSWILHDQIATLATNQKSYGDMELFEEIRGNWVKRYFFSGALFFALGLFITGISVWVSRDALRQARKLRKKYRVSLKQDQNR